MNASRTIGILDDMPIKQTVPFVVDAEGTGVAQRLVAAGEHEHVFSTDSLPSFGGEDAAPSPLSYLLGALTSCNQVTGSLVASGLGVTVGRWSFHIQGDLDPSVIAGGAEGNANFDKVAVQVSVETDATDEQFETFASETERRCPVTQMFKRSGLAYTSDWKRLPLS